MGLIPYGTGVKTHNLIKVFWATKLFYQLATASA